jgi:protein SCO1/2
MTTARAERVVWVGLGLVLVAVIGAGVWSLWRGAPGTGEGSLPVLGVVPDFTLTERSGRSVSRADLDGSPWVANFVFTSCAGVCPLLSMRMAEIRRTLDAEQVRARSVSFSVDPSRDSVAVLRDYAARYDADPATWLFVTGGREPLYRLITEGFKLSVAERSPPPTGAADELITHSDRFVLVDAAGRIRGYYRGTDEDLVPRLVADLRRLQTGS